MLKRIAKISNLTLLIAGSQVLVGQSLQTGALVGVVRDAADKPLAGVTVRARSGQVDRSAVTNARGEYRLPLLNPGSWRLMVAEKGYQTFEVAVSVSINETKTANVGLQPVASVVVEVQGRLDGLDYTTSQVTTNFDATKLTKIPASMTSLNALDSVLSTMPGVESTTSGAYNIRGAADNQNLFTVDGTIVNNSRDNSSGGDALQASTKPAREFLEDVEVVTGGFGAEYGVMGGAVNMTTKSGTNAWAGEVFYSSNFPDQNAKVRYNRTTVPPQAPPAAMDKFHRYGATVSGPLVKDKLFFFVGYQGFKDNLPATNSQNGTNWNGLKSDPRTVDGPNLVSMKVNWFLSENHQFVLSASHSDQKTSQGHAYPDQWSAGTFDYGATTRESRQSLNLTWNWIAQPNLILVASVSDFKNTTNTTSNDASMNGTSFIVQDYRYWVDGPGRDAPNKPADFERWSYNTGTGNGPSRNSNPSQQVRLDATWILGRHEIKGGYLQLDTRTDDSTSGTLAWSVWNSTVNYSPDGDFTELYQSFQTPSSQILKGHYRSYYLKDLFEIIPGLRVDAGLRYDPFKFVGGSGPFQGRLLGTFDDLDRQIQPRLGVTWDVHNDGRVKLFAHWGRFFERQSMESVDWAYATSEGYRTWTQDHYDYNSDYRAGQPVFTLHNGADGKPVPADFSFTYGEVGKPSARVEDLKLPHKDMITLGGDWLLPGGWQIGSTWVYWDMKNMLARSLFLNQDGSAAVDGLGYNTVLWNPHPGPVTFLDSDGERQTWTSSFPDPKDRYLSLELHARHDGTWYSVDLSYDWVHHYGNYRESNTGTSFPDFRTYQAIAAGNSEVDPVHQVKISGTCTVDLFGQKLDIGPLITWRSGTGISKSVPLAVLFNRDGNVMPYQGDFDLSVQPDNRRCDMGTTPASLLVDLNLSMAIKAWKTTINPTVSVSNFFNRQTVSSYYTTLLQGATQASATLDPNFGKISTWQQGRSFTAGVSVKF
jgi:hypothetical protein